MSAVLDPPRLLTLGRMAEILRQPAHRLAYIIQTRNISPSGYAGRLRVFDRAALARLRYELNLLDARQSGGEVASCALPP